MLKVKEVLQEGNDKKETILVIDNIDANDKLEDKEVATARTIINIGSAKQGTDTKGRHHRSE